jgi:4-alpha-glucanotransferase
MERGCGVLLPISSLPNKYGYGCFSKEAYEFVDFLSELGMKYWQILPLGEVDNVGSPYSSVSAFAGEPLYIDIEKYLNADELEFYKLNSSLPLWSYRERKKEALRYVFDKLYYSTNIDKFIEENESWVYDYAVYMVLQEELKTTYSHFPKEYKNNDSPETIKFIQGHSEDIVYYIFLQYLFFKQWTELKSYANKKGIKIIGDVPIYCSMDSVDMYANPRCFQLDQNKRPLFVSGVPGDYFNPEGQIWGNPLYDFNYMKQTKYHWWVQRLKHLTKLYDLIRIDHFRAFESYFEVPYGDKNVKRGKWRQGPGIDIFNEFEKNDIDNLILEDLGDISDEVRALRKQTGLAGMKVMQFAFDGDSKNLHLPHDYEKNSVAYLGTHDNDTFVGFLSNHGQKEKFCEYFGISKNSSKETITKIAIEDLLSTNSNVCILSMQDILFEGSECRINTPATDIGNWVYKLNQNYKQSDDNKYLKLLINLKNR